MIRRILVALDGSNRAPAVLDAAAEIARCFGARLVPFRAVVVPPEFPPAARASHDDTLPIHLEAEAIAELRALTRSLARVEVEEPVVTSGQPWRAILDCAEALDVDLIVIGSHGYRGLDHVLGTTAGKVANSAHRNVLVVHHRDPRPAVSADRHDPPVSVA